MPLVKYKKAQAAIDFMMSYGIALIVIFIAVVIIYNVSVASPALTTMSCTPSAGFACETFALNRSGVLLLQLSQATGGLITIRGAACSSLPNSTSNVLTTRPAYGNIQVANTANTFYPPYNSPGTGINVYSDESAILMLYCFSGSGIATGPLGNSYTGYVWLNYTVPGYGNLTEQVASLSVKYT